MVAQAQQTGASGEPTQGPTGDDIVAYALSERGKPYQFGATGPDAFDCSGLVKFVYNHFGINTPRTTFDMTGPGTNLVPIQRNQLASGDLIFSRWPGESRPSSHVGIYDGRGNIIEAPQPGQFVQVTKLTDGYWSHVDQTMRVPGLSGGTAGGSTGPSVIQYLEGVGAGVATAIAGPNLAGWIATPGTITEGLTNIGTAAGSIANDAAQAGHLAGLITRMFLPNNLLRGALLTAGSVFLLIGIWLLVSEVRDG